MRPAAKRVCACPARRNGDSTELAEKDLYRLFQSPPPAQLAQATVAHREPPSRGTLGPSCGCCSECVKLFATEELFYFFPVDLQSSEAVFVLDCS